MARRHLGAIRYRITPIDADVTLTVSMHVDGDVVNEDSNYDAGFWLEVGRSERVNVTTSTPAQL